MRRYLYTKNTNFKTDLFFDCIVAGAGMAGLYAVLCLDKNKKIALITKDNFEDFSSSSRLAQGGIAAVLTDDDCFESHVADTLTAGAGHCKQEAVEVLVKEGPEDIKKLIELSVPFDRNDDGQLRITREGGHSRRRIIHCGGDATGKLVTETLVQRVKELPNVTIMNGAYLVDVLTEGKDTKGVVINKNEECFALYSENVIIATGGAGQLYRYSTNPPGTKGEGIAACMRAGAATKDMEFVQFHPTSLSLSESADRMFLVSEAVRGEGGILKNAKGEAFMEGIHPLKDLAPRDIVTRAILAEMKKQGENEMYLDVSSMSEEFFAERFPTIYKECKKYGVNVPKEPIPIRPTQHYIMGGVETDLDGKTNINGLYVVGEAACTGVQGANRLASNSTLECLVFARHAAMCVNKQEALKPYQFENCTVTASKHISDSQAKEALMYIRTLMTNKAGALRKKTELKEALEELEKAGMLFYDVECDSIEKLTLLNAVTVCKEIVSKALLRDKSIGSHYLVD